ncbi:hypothetical protein GC170_15250 [bacterium]|nr:hypothetical protein [bacterium]
MAVTILLLIILEGLLSADNALVLAVLVRHLPKEQQKRALRYGIIGAFVFRFIAVLFAAILLEYWIFKIVGAAYLIILAMKHFLGEGHDEEIVVARKHGFWRTVIGVELADIAFSIDSILAAVAMAEGLRPAIKETEFLGQSLEIWTVWIGGLLGIVTMRYVAGLFISLLDKLPGLASAAYQLVMWIGIKLFASGLDQAFHLKSADVKSGWRQYVPQWLLDSHLEIPEPIFWTVMLAIIGIALLRSLSKRSRLDPEFVETMRDLGQMEKTIDQAAGETIDSVEDVMTPDPDNSRNPH